MFWSLVSKNSRRPALNLLSSGLEPQSLRFFCLQLLELALELLDADLVGDVSVAVACLRELLAAGAAREGFKL